MRFSEGPPICVTLHFESKRLHKAALILSNQFECKIKGDGDAAPYLAFLEAYGKKKSAAIDLPWAEITPFRLKALQALQNLPFGETVTYGGLAQLIGHPNAARAIGSACHHNPFPLFVPCHRVIASQGRIGGFAYPLKMKELLLSFEEN